MALQDFDLLPLRADTAIKPFKCKDSDLNGFLLEDAQKYLENLMAVTYLLEDNANGKTVAYYSLLNDKITFDPEQRSIWNRLTTKYPMPKDASTIRLSKSDVLPFPKVIRGRDLAGTFYALSNIHSRMETEPVAALSR